MELLCSMEAENIGRRKAPVCDLYGEICKIVKLIVPFRASDRECHADCKKDDWK